MGLFFSSRHRGTRQNRRKAQCTKILIITLIKTQSRPFRTSDWAEGSPFKAHSKSGLQTTLWMSLSGPATAWTWTQSNISGETWKCASVSIQPDRPWEVKRRRIADNCQRLIRKACLIKQKKTWDCKGASEKYLINEYLCNVLISVFNFLINVGSCDNSVFTLSIWCMECKTNIY